VPFASPQPLVDTLTSFVASIGARLPKESMCHKEGHGGESEGDDAYDDDVDDYFGATPRWLPGSRLAVRRSQEVCLGFTVHLASSHGLVVANFCFHH